MNKQKFTPVGGTTRWLTQMRVDTNGQGGEVRETAATDEWCSKTPNHKHNVIARQDTGDYVCVKCGLVLGRVSSNDIKYPKEYYPIYTHEALTDKNLGTSPQNTFLHSTQKVTPIELATQRRLKNAATNFGFSQQERKLRGELSYLDSMGAALQLPKHIRQKASVSYQRVHKIVKGRGRLKELILCGLLLACAKSENYPLSLHDIKRIMGFSRRDATMVATNTKRFAQALGFSVAPTNRHAKLNTIATNMNLPPNLTHKAEQVIKAIDGALLQSGFCGYSSETIVGSVVHYVAQESNYPLSVDALANCLGLTKITISNGAQKVRDFANNGGKNIVREIGD